MQLKVGDIVRIGRRAWPATSGKIGILIRRTYLGYEEKYSKWCVMTNGETKIIHQSNLFVVCNK